MIDLKKIERLAREVRDIIPKNIHNFYDDTEKKIYQLLQRRLSKMDFVSREEFDLQVQVLLRTREKVEMLEKRLNLLEGHEPSSEEIAKHE